MSKTDIYRVKPGEKVVLADIDPNEKTLYKSYDKPKGYEKLLALNEELEYLQELMFAEGKHKVLIVLQATDTGGKDGTIRHVFEGVNPAGVRVAPFKKPTEEELAHDYLWRIHKQTPRSGEIVIFNRSHYESVLVERVKKIAPREVWSKRYRHIKEFEKILTDEGTTILKFYLHISKEEQKERLQERLDRPEKNWKFNPGDLEDRKLWNQYQTAFQDMVNKTSTEDAPWYVIPADRKWYRNLLISTIIIEKLKSLDMQFPEPFEGIENIVIGD